MKNKAYALTIVALGATLVIARAQTTQTTAKAQAPPPALSPTEQTIKDIKNPAPWFNWGADLRVRNEYFNNAQTLTSDPNLSAQAGLHSQDYFRFRGRLWASAVPLENLSLNARLAAEPRLWMEPSSSANYRESNAGNSGMEWRYGIFDNLNVCWTNMAGLPAQIKVGRQDLYFTKDGMPGDGWLVADATPLDGSWTFFFDAARLTYNIEDLKTTIDAVGLVQYARPDAWLPTLGPSTTAGSPAAYGLTDQNEKGAILWIANKSMPAANIDGYFMYKHDTRVNNPPPVGTFGDDADIYTVGARFSGLVKEHWKYSAEGAYQFGQKKDPFLNRAGNNALLSPGAQTTDFRDLSAFGFNNKLSYLFNDKLKNQVFVSYEFLSGDDSNTKQDEMFDVLWGRWPRWSELYIPYSYIPETRTGQVGNIHRFGPGWSLVPMRNMDFSLNYNLMYSDQDTPTRANQPQLFSRNGSFRGHYLQAILKYKFSQHVSGHLWSEFVFPGNFYASGDQAMTFLRAELWFTF
jgi:hypothetical protein